MRFTAAYDEEISREVPKIEQAFDEAILAGLPYDLPVLELLGEAAPPPAKVNEQPSAPRRKAPAKKAPASRAKPKPASEPAPRMRRKSAQGAAGRSPR